MKKLVTLSLVGVVMALTACSTSQNNGGMAVHNKEAAAPYADERTVGHEQAPAPAERMYETTQRK